MMSGEAPGIEESERIKLAYDILFLGRRSFANREGNRNMVDEEFTKGTGNTQDNHDVSNSMADNAKTNILSNIQSMMGNLVGKKCCFTS